MIVASVGFVFFVKLRFKIRNCITLSLDASSVWEEDDVLGGFQCLDDVVLGRFGLLDLVTVEEKVDWDRFLGKG